jgi:hypothetical protein
VTAAPGSAGTAGVDVPTGAPRRVSSVLPWMEGAWVRSARAYGSGPPGECSDVIWIQVGEWFADFRLPRPGGTASHPFDRAHAFSGVLEVLDSSGTSATVAWHHDLDTDHTSTDASGEGASGDDSADAGHLSLGGGLLVESGDGYVEWWSRPAASADGPPGWVVAHVDPVAGAGAPVDGRMVCADGMAVAVWGAAGGAGGAWPPAGLPPG